MCILLIERILSWTFNLFFFLYPHVTAGAADLVRFWTGSRYDHLHTDHTGSGIVTTKIPDPYPDLANKDEKLFLFYKSQGYIY